MPTDQARTFEIFLGLCQVRQEWAGRLLLGIGLNETGRTLALASLAAGSAGLFLEQDPGELRTARREGCCTFSVTTLEEAVRALKNEVRQGRAVTLALNGDPVTWLDEIVARGLQPDALAFARAPYPAEADLARTLQDQGSQVLHGLGLADWAGGADLQAGVYEAIGERREIRTDPALTMLDRRERDRALIASSDNTGASLRWLRTAPSLFPRALQRVSLHSRSTI